MVIYLFAVQFGGRFLVRADQLGLATVDLLTQPRDLGLPTVKLAAQHIDSRLRRFARRFISADRCSLLSESQ